jgi:tetratricopeptide (TPR) repeat protein
MLFERYRKWVIQVSRAALDDCTDMQEHSSLLDTVGVLYSSQGRYSDAEKFISQCVELRTSTQPQGDNHPQTLAAKSRFAGVLQDQGKFTEAHELYKSCLESQRSIIGKDHPDTLETTSRLAGVLQDQGKYSEAQDAYGSCIKGQKSTLGEHHPDTLETMISWP